MTSKNLLIDLKPPPFIEEDENRSSDEHEDRAGDSLSRVAFAGIKQDLTRTSVDSSGNRRSGLKTVHSGRSLSSGEGDHSSSSHVPPPSPGGKGRLGLLTRAYGVGPGQKSTTGQRPQLSQAPTVKSVTAPAPPQPTSNPRAKLLASRLTLPSSKSRFQSTPDVNSNNSSLGISNESHHALRRYKPGDKVLVCNHHSRWATLVNKHGFPDGEGTTPEEQRGPYIYVLATVKKVHFEEFAAFYTVVRADTGAEQRADTDFMEPLRSLRGETAALMAATQSDRGQVDDSLYQRETYHDALRRNKILTKLQKGCGILLLPLVALYRIGDLLLEHCWLPCSNRVLAVIRRQSQLLLNGLEPYSCRMRVTMVNFVVLCSTWYMFIDQVRLAFLPKDVDNTIATINMAVWTVLLLELLFELFIRPDGFRNLIISEKAFAPTTVRYINSFHLLVESVSLAIFVPEFYCILGDYSCSDRTPFSFHHAILMSVVGDSRLQTFYGRAYLALIRLRVFGLVRHWKNMWIANTFINMKWRSRQNGIMATIIPNRSWRASSKSQEKGKSTGMDEAKRKEVTLTNASSIGTALMVTNSYRALAILWVIVGLLPLIFCFLNEKSNRQAMYMTRQLQGTNLIASDTSNETCHFFNDSIESWYLALSSPSFYAGSKVSYLLKAVVQPSRCFKLFGGAARSSEPCEILKQRLSAKLENLASNPDFNLQYWTSRWSSILEVCADTIRYEGINAENLAKAFGIRSGSILIFEEASTSNLTFFENMTTVERQFTSQSGWDETFTVQTAYVSNIVDIALLLHPFLKGSFFVIYSSISAFLLQMCMLFAVLGGLSVLRRDAEVLVLGPLRRMLKIVARYAKNPLIQPRMNHRFSLRRKLSSRQISGGREESASFDSSSSDNDTQDEYAGGEDVQLGSYETGQLITAVTKITDLLRKCWGVAGADIIQVNLATREGALAEVFNPTVPGKSVYALFGFAAINGFDFALQRLGGEIMILINDVAAVLHGEVFRWGFGDSGQCNKNLGSAFLMVFRIGLVKEVIEKLEQATDVVFSTGTAKVSQASQARRRHRQTSSGNVSEGSTISASSGIKTNRSQTISRKLQQRSSSIKAMSLSLQSLPGISTFTDRAVIGMLKSFAGIHRDNKIRAWNNDFRLGAGVGVFSVSMVYGMDAGWAVEGAVGSEYKIDATYLSPHVNMASRMMGACKMYGVSIMLSQAVQELMSDVACSKLRHLDTVTVKGSSVKQKIFTYDAKPKGVDFFLYSRSDEQADVDADRYTPNIWNTDQDLKAMRQHITDDFLHTFSEGRKAYFAGDWSTAMKKLERANEIMVETALEEGYLEEEIEKLQMHEDARAAAEEIKRENGDGPSLYLINFMKAQGGVAPTNWDGWHPLTRK